MIVTGIQQTGKSSEPIDGFKFLFIFFAPNTRFTDDSNCSQILGSLIKGGIPFSIATVHCPPIAHKSLDLVDRYDLDERDGQNHQRSEACHTM